MYRDVRPSDNYCIILFQSTSKHGSVRCAIPFNSTIEEHGLGEGEELHGLLPWPLTGEVGTDGEPKSEELLHWVRFRFCFEAGFLPSIRTLGKQTITALLNSNRHRKEISSY